MSDEQWFENVDAFYSDREERALSMEWDFGVMWIERVGVDWPNWRVSWSCRTGEVYAAELRGNGRVLLLGEVPPVGEYPANASMDAWSEWKNRQHIDDVLAGWCDDDPVHKPLDWVRTRLNSRAARLAREAAAFA